MENLFRVPKKIILLGSLLFLFSCNQDEISNNDLQGTTFQSLTEKKSASKINVFKGPEIALGYGKVRSWISVYSNGQPKEIGIEITKEALLHPSRDKNNSQPEGSTIAVPLHFKAKQATPFDHIGLNWNPNGHEPEHVFDVPHFDIHFYMISLENQLAIPA